jgi:hypothetical protein
MFRGDRVMLHTHDPDALLHIEMGMMVPHPPQPPTPAFPGRRRRADPLPRLRRRTDAPPHDLSKPTPHRRLFDRCSCPTRRSRCG